MKIFSAQLKGTTTVATGSNVSLTGSFSGSIAGIDINSTNTFTGSTSNRLNSIEIISASNVSRLNSLESFSSSVYTTNTFTSSTSERLSALETTSASVDTLNTNQNTRLNSLEEKTGSLASTGSNTFYGTQVFSGSVYVKENLIVQGSSSLQNITASAVDIGTNKIILNVDNPAVRFAGISVYDSGSTQGTGSLWWDSTQNHWLYEHPSDSAAPYNSAILISGPKNTGNLGEETELVSNFVMKAVGGDHISASAIYDDGSTIALKSNTQITGSLSVMGDGGVLNRTSSGEPYLFFRKDGVNRGSIYGISGGGIRIFDQSDNQILTITSSFVGIGVTTPSKNLHVLGSSQVISYFQTSGTYAPITWTGDNGVTKGGVTAHSGYITIGQLNSGGTGVDGDRALTIMSGSGFVGINTTSTTVPFTIKTSGNTLDGSLYSTFTINNTTATNTSWSRIRFDRSGVAQWGVGEYDSSLRISNLNENGTGGANDATFVIKNNNYVGIGTTNPIHRLSVNGNARFIITPAGSNDSDRITIAQNNGSYGIDLVAYGSGAQPYSSTQGIFSWGGYDALIMAQSANIKFVTGTYTERMRLTNGGLLGIGTTSPNSMLHIDGGGTRALRIDVNSGIQGISISPNGIFGIDEPGVGNGRFIINTNGRVGIGTTNPSFKLHVLNTTGDDGTWSGGILIENTGSPAGEPAIAFKNTAVASGNYVFAGLNQSNNFSVAFGTSFTDANTKFQITSGGQILTWGNPAFYAYGNTGNTGSGEYLIYPTVHVNRGGHYNASNGVFTAPVAGLYFFSWTSIGNTTNDVYRFFIRVNNSNWGGDHQLRQDTNESGSAYATNGNRSVMINLSANDTVRIYFASDAGSIFYGANSTADNYLNFFGYLIG